VLPLMDESEDMDTTISEQTNAPEEAEETSSPGEGEQTSPQEGEHKEGNSIHALAANQNAESNQAQSHNGAMAGSKPGLKSLLLQMLCFGIIIITINN